MTDGAGLNIDEAGCFETVEIVHCRLGSRWRALGMKVSCWLVFLCCAAWVPLGCGSSLDDQANVGSIDGGYEPDASDPTVPDSKKPHQPQGDGCLNFSNGPFMFLPTAVLAKRIILLTLTSCDFADNRIVSVTIVPADAPFALADPEGDWDPATEEWVVPAWQQKQLQVLFQPTEPSPIANGVVEAFTATLHVEYRYEGNEGDDVESADILLSGQAVRNDCITAVVSASQQVASPLAVRLDGLSSISPMGPLTGYEWSVDGPADATQVFTPSAEVATTVFAADTAGSYSFSLAVTDGAGTPQCEIDPINIDLDGVAFEPSPPTPDTGLEVILLWRTPGDWHFDDGEPVSNVDLHLGHDWAGGPDLDDDGLPDGWFDTPYDCWAGNPGPHWGINEPGSTDDPDFFGDGEAEGPEQILLPGPEELPYRIGVHYRDDLGLGPVFARVAVYLHGELVMESHEQLLWELDLWEVATVDWPEQTVTTLTVGEGEPKILNDYSNPYDQ